MGRITQRSAPQAVSAAQSIRAGDAISKPIPWRGGRHPPRRGREAAGRSISATPRAVKGSTTGAGKITRQEFVDYFELARLSIGAAFVNSAKRGQPASMRQIWGKDIAFLYLDNMVTRTDFAGLTWGYSPTFGSRIAGPIEDPNIGLEGGQVVRVGEMTTELVVAKAAGALVANAIG